MSGGQFQLVFGVMGAFRHDSACLHLHPDQQPFLGGQRDHGVCRDNGARWDKGGCRNKGGCRDDGGFWVSWLLWLVNVCV